MLLPYANRKRRFAEFLPDVEGVIEHGHSPVAGMLIILVAATFGGILTWSALTEVERVVSAEGQIEPAGRVKLVNHPVGGKVAELFVAEGQRVAAGDPLLTLDAEVISAELADLTGRWQAKAAEVARLEAEAAGATELQAPAELAAERPDLIRAQQELMAARRESRASELDSLRQAARQRASERAALTADLGRLKQSEQLLTAQATAVRGLAEQGLYPRLNLMDVDRQLNELSGEIRRTEAGRHAAEAALARAKSDEAGSARQWQADVLAELAAARNERDQLAEARKRQQVLARNLLLLAPVAGIVQELAVTGPGQSVGSNQTIMKLVPTDGGVVIEASVANQDIGYLQVGQSAKIKVRAFDFVRYGALEGRIERIAADASRERGKSEERFGITLRALDQAPAAGKERIPVLPGMTVDVDLLVGERTILSYFTDRIFRLPDQLLRDG